MILSVLFFPRIRLGKVSASTFWIVTLVGALILMACGQVNFDALGDALLSDTAVNPLKILALFISMTALSIFLDELGFFSYLASAVLKRAHTGQKRLFVLLYVVVSVLTVFTSNDIVVLSFTPFICYFARNAKIDPTPYLAAEFVAANTWSMLLIIGNPTNIYLATAFEVGFLEYLKISALPSLFAGTAAFLLLYLMFRRKLSAPIEGQAERIEIKNKPLLAIGVAHLALCTVMLAIASYIGVQMWIISVASVGSLLVCVCIASLVQKRKPVELLGVAKRTPYQLIPFVLSMFVMIIALDDKGVCAAIANFFGTSQPILVYGASSFLSANLINNIPMSVLFSSIISNMGGGQAAFRAVFATVIGSNIGAYFTPIGALAGIMWSSILNSQGIKFTYLDFLKIGFFIAVPTLFAGLAGLYVVI